MRKSVFLIVVSSFLFIGWGKTGHKIINQNSLKAFTQDILFLNEWASTLVDHASDADNRKSADPNESPKHYIDIDEYSEFVYKGSIIENYDSLVQKYGENVIIDRGLLPWAILNTVESLSSTFADKDWDKAMLLASDLGHYVGDAHMPLHITKNYNGQYTGQNGIHSRYESNMIGTYSSQINYVPSQCMYVDDISHYVFDFIYSNYNYVDSVLLADKNAKILSQGNFNNVYYESLWNSSRYFTIKLFSNASSRLASLIYTAWINAGSPSVTGLNDAIAEVSSFKLFQNYPNPFNPTTLIKFSISERNNSEMNYVKLDIIDVLGKIIETPVNEYKPSGDYEFEFNAGNFSSGIYFYRLKVGSFSETKKMLLIR